LAVFAFPAQGEKAQTKTAKTVNYFFNEPGNVNLANHGTEGFFSNVKIYQDHRKLPVILFSIIPLCDICPISALAVPRTPP
jgi:hypothetical protein